MSIITSVVVVKGVKVAIVVDVGPTGYLEEYDLLPRLMAAYPDRHGTDPIVPGVPQWICGDHVALNYRGNSIGRHKMWFQETNPLEDGRYFVYSYTGWQTRILPATSSWTSCKELTRFVKIVKALCDTHGWMHPNHCIVTRYENPGDCIGLHSDKVHTIAKSTAELKSMIIVLKLGPGSRRFVITDLNEVTVFDQVMTPGSAVLMSVEENQLCKHAVPPSDSTQLSGSLVFRTIVKTVTTEELANKLASTSYKEPMNSSCIVWGSEWDDDK